MILRYENIFCTKENNNFIQQFLSSVSHYSTIFGEYHIRKQCMQCIYADTLFNSDQSVNNVKSVSAYGAADTEQHTLFTYVIYSKMAQLGDTEETNC